MKHFIDERDFDTEKAKLLALLKAFHTEGQESSKNARHPHWGEFTPREWARGQYKHLDHHLRQFGV